MVMNFKSVKDSATEYIRNKIITGEFIAGHAINETALASRLDISRPPIREALRTLENEHLVVSVPRKGTYVSELSAEDLKELYQLREMVEGYSVELLKEKNIRNLPAVSSTLEEFSRLPMPDHDNMEQRLIYLRSAYDFHIKLVDSSGNKMLTQWNNSICSHLNRYQFIYFYIPDSKQCSREDHQEILDLIEVGDYENAHKSLITHIRYTLEFLLNRISVSEIAIK